MAVKLPHVPRDREKNKTVNQLRRLEAETQSVSKYGLESLPLNQPGATTVAESHHGRYPRFDENGAVPGFLYVSDHGQGTTH